MITTGTQVDNLKVGAKIASGGFAHVYLAVPEGGGTPLALKTLGPEHGADPLVRERLATEIQRLARLDHPHIVRVEASGEHDGMPYMTMEYVAGPTLWKLVKKARRAHRFEPGMVAWLGAQVARALDAAHGARSADGAPAGVLHGDVSPANILVSAEGEARLIDFGASEDLGARGAVAIDTVIGKLQYLSPEQLGTGPVDARADQFALGVTLFWALAGTHPYAATTRAELVAARAQRDTPRLSAVNSELPLVLDELIATLMAWEPSARFPTSAHAADALEAAACRLGASHEACAEWVLDVCATASELPDDQNAPSPMDPPRLVEGLTPRPSFDLGQVAQHQDRRFDAGPAQFDALSQGGNTALAGSAGEGGPGHRHRAVAVAIGFHHGHQAGCWADPALEAAGIRTDCSGVHLHPCPLTGQSGFSGLSAPAGLGGLGHGSKARL